MSFLRRLLNLGRDQRVSRDIEREVQFHLDQRAAELRAQGMSAEDAAFAARRQFGNPTFLREETRDADVVTWLDSIQRDVAYGLRALRHTPAFTVVAVASLALGIGANTAIYSLIDAVVLRPLPVPHPEELIFISSGDRDGGGAYFTNPLW